MADAISAIPARRLNDPDLSTLPRAQLEAMHDAAATVLRCEAALRKSGMSVVTETLRGQGDFTLWERYPKGDVWDVETHSQYFYHAHDAAEMADGENGHFHLFLRASALLPDVQPWRLPGARVPQDEAARFVHLAALSVDARGRPLRLFATNRWVTDETFVRSAEVIDALDRFSIELAHPNWAVNEWLTGMVRLYRPHIAALLQARDEAIAAYAARRPDAEVLEERSLQNIAEIRLDVPAHVAAIETVLGL